MSELTEYQKAFVARHKHGRNFKETVIKQNEIDFNNFLISSPNSIDARINESLETTRLATILVKENETETKRYFLSSKEDGIKVGDFVYWDDTVWLLFFKPKSTIATYDKFEGLECKHEINWIDSFGVKQTAPCYLIAQTDEKVKGNFRTWNNMITPQPNKNLEIITSRRDIPLGQKFLIENTAWFVVETDYISVSNIIYMSLTEDKIDEYLDNIPEQLANCDELNKYSVELGETNINLGINDEYQINPQICLNGNLYSDEINYEITEGSEIITIENNVIRPVILGHATVRVSMKDNSEVYSELFINITEAEEKNIVYDINGDDSIKWGRTKNFEIIKTVNGVQEEIVSPVVEIIDEEKLCNYKVENNMIIITGNTENKVGEITMKVLIEEVAIIKTIDIVSLWM